MEGPPDSADGPLLEVERLTIAFPPRDGGAAARAVSGLSFTVARREIVGLVGESGSGKSLTALALVGLVPAPGTVSAGRIRFEGRDLAQAPESELRQVRGAGIGLVFQEPMTAFNPVLDVGDQIVETIRAHRRIGRRAAAARALELLELAAIDEPRRVFGSPPHRLSGGQRQRALLALAVAAEPRLLVADEPTSALDSLVQRQILDLLARFRAELGLAILLISHDLAVVGALADRVLVLRAGELVEEGTWSAISDTPREPYTRELVDAARRGAA